MFFNLRIVRKSPTETFTPISAVLELRSRTNLLCLVKLAHRVLEEIQQCVNQICQAVNSQRSQYDLKLFLSNDLSCSLQSFYSSKTYCCTNSKYNSLTHSRSIQVELGKVEGFRVTLKAWCKCSSESYQSFKFKATSFLAAYATWTNQLVPRSLALCVLLPFNIFLVFIFEAILYAFLYLVVVPLRILSFSKESCHVTINKEVSKHDTESSMFSVSEAILWYLHTSCVCCSIVGMYWLFLTISMIADHCLGTVLHFMELIVRSLLFYIWAIPPNGCHLCPQDIIGPKCIKINYKIHFIIKQSVLHINLTANVKYIIKKVI